MRILVFAGSSMDRGHNIVFKPDPDDRLGVDVDRTVTAWTEPAELIDASYQQAALRRQPHQLCVINFM